MNAIYAYIYTYTTYNIPGIIYQVIYYTWYMIPGIHTLYLCIPGIYFRYIYICIYYTYTRYILYTYQVYIIDIPGI